jgi:DNA-binding NarL/FixJ family response regulator
VPLRCLIVDDNLHFRMAARDLLSRQGVSVVGLAATGSEALRQAHELNPDVALVDIDLGAESGFDVVRLLAETPHLAALRLLLISSYAERDFVDLIDASPAVGFISKSDLSENAISAALGGNGDGDGPSRG